jgi:exodeoxyribonuclease-5
MKTENSILDFLHFSKPTKDQTDVLIGIQSFLKTGSDQDFFILRGAAGTGKTSIISAVVGFLNFNSKPFKIAAPTGRAARIVGKKTNSTASTIHSMIYIPESNGKTGVVTFKLKSKIDENPCLYIIDEASMIASKSKSEGMFRSEANLLSELIKFVKNANPKNKFLFIGDDYQLPPVGEECSNGLNKNFLSDKCQLKGTLMELNEVKRQEDGSYILENATGIRNSIDCGETKHEILGEQSKNINYAVINYVKDLKNNGPEHSVAIGVSHKANKYFNDLTRTRIYGNNKNLLEPGDLLMVTKNWSRNDVVLYNGDQVQLVEVDWNSVETVCDLNFVAIKFKPLFSDEIFDDLLLVESITELGGQIDYKLEGELLKSRFIKNRIFRESQKPSDDRYVGAIRLMYGHSITCQKAQGGEWNKVFINTMGIPGLRWQYTAVTRGVKEIERF